jgi:DNA modification methylase
MIHIYQGSMQEQLINVADNSIDLLLTDPPYNISENGATPVWIDKETGENKSSIHNQKFSDTFSEKWDEVSHEDFLLQMKDWSELWFKKIRKGGTFAVFISDQYISYLWKIMEETGFEPKRVWTWKKPAAVPFNRSVNPVSGCEYVLWGIKPGGKRTFNSDSVKGNIIERYASADKVSSIVYKMVKDCENLSEQNLNKIFEDAKKEALNMLKSRKTDENNSDIVQCVVPNFISYSGGLGKNKIHPTEKPVEVLEYFVSLLSNEGDTILDTFAGSGSTGVAAHKLNRNCILVERDSSMFSKMNERIQGLYMVDQEFQKTQNV